MSDRLLKIEEVALASGVSVKTINFWYMFRRENPDNEYAKMLPEYIQMGERKQRFWTEDAIWKLIEFKKVVPKGCRGVMGGTTHKTKENKNGKKKYKRKRGAKIKTCKT